ncbi:type I secretion system permease/ATPase [Castellaniella sp.]|uniref:type I secretion system permease/ATPase n=1 Tax=Castellaniella sp. TaxID=1955812 RepID=UPI00356A6911
MKSSDAAARKSALPGQDGVSGHDNGQHDGGHEGTGPSPRTASKSPGERRQWRVHSGDTHDDPLLDSLVLILRHYGVESSAQALVQGLPLVDHRLVPSLLARAAARAHCSARFARRTLDQLPSGLLPAILMLADERACLLFEVGKDACMVQFPEGGGPVRMPRAELERDYTGLVAFVRPEFRFEKRDEAGVKPRSGHWFWGVVMENRRLYRDVVVAALLINLFAIAMPLFTMNVYDRVVPSNAVETLWVLATGIGLVLVFNYLLTTIRAYVVDRAAKRIDVQLSALIMERVLDLRMENRPASVGSFASNLRAFESVRDFIASASLTTLVDLPFIFLFLGVMAWISPYMLIPPVIAMVLVFLVSLAAQVRMEDLTVKTFQASAQRNAVLVEALAGMEPVKTLNARSHMQRKYEGATQFLAHIGGQLKLISATTVGFVQMAQQLVSVAVIMIGVYLAAESQISLGGIIAASMISSRCLAPLGQVAGLLIQYHQAKTSLASVDQAMEMPVEHPEGRQFVPRARLRGEIEFRNVSFTYPGSEQPAVSRISFRIMPGEKVGVIGRVGSGKSTIEKLVLGLYQPTAGMVLVDGVDAAQIDPIDLRRNIGYVAQDAMLFYGSLKDNLLLSAPFATYDDMLDVARVAGVDEFAYLHPEGYDMPIGERGDSLSGGQRQAVGIARALINDPPILLLDEPSSNMDHQSEAQLRARLLEAGQDKTVVLVTHRTALLEMVDRLMVVDRGRIVADGPKAQVMEALRAGRVSRAEARS